MHERREKAAKEAAKTEGNVAPCRQVETSHACSGEQQYRSSSKRTFQTVGRVAVANAPGLGPSLSFFS